ncbi:MAG: radical SAM protein [Candidatus Omnitrophica bacterium]|nr:radical SAM protein [Candidatus Omnitrophota bacterium]
MIVPLINCPSWHLDYPPYNLALLKAVLTQNGFESACFDLNLAFYNQITNDIERKSWLAMQEGNCWEHKEFVVKLFQKHRAFIEDYVFRIIGLSSEVICFTVHERNRYFTYMMAEMFKENSPEKKIVFGGPSCFRSIHPGFKVLLESCADALCLGEGEEPLVDFLRILKGKGVFTHCPGFVYKAENGNVVDCGDGPIVENLDSLPYADYSDFDMKAYLTKGLSVLTSKGCNNKCSFCSERYRMRKYRVRSAKSVFSEITQQLAKYPYIKQLWFNDSLINGDVSMLDTFCTLLLDHNVNILWGGQACIKEEMSLDLLKKMKKAGCYILSYGLESGSDNVLRLMRKGYDTALAERVLKNTYEAGIGLNFNIICGFPGETEKEFQETIDFIRRNIKYAQKVTLNALYLERGSELRLNPQKWDIRSSEEDFCSGWSTLDGINNPHERFRRLRILQETVGEKYSINTDREIAFNLRQGDRLLQQGKREESLNYYLAAKKGEQDDKMKQVIESKISVITENREGQVSMEIRDTNKPISFSWDLLLTCNYRCPYCWFHGKWQDVLKLNKCLRVEEWVKHWRRIYDRYGRAKIEMLGGEPFLYPNFIELVSELAKLHFIRITSNLSTSIDKFIDRIDPSQVELGATFHPLFASIDEFLPKAKRLKEAGFISGVTCLGYPPYLKQMECYRERFKEYGLGLSILTFWGEYKGTTYPQGYTEEEKEIIRHNVGEREGEKFQLVPKQVEGKLCYAGVRYGVIHLDGKVFRCGGGVTQEGIGSIFDENFSLWEKPKPCRAEFCRCNEWAFLLKENTDNREKLKMDE